MIALLIALATGTANAGDAAELSAWSVSAVQFLPSDNGDRGVRARQRVGIDSPIGDVWAAHADGALRLVDASQDTSTGELYRLSVRRPLGDKGDLSLGRMVRLDSRGFQHLDGISATMGGDRTIRPTAWAGRAWQPEDGDAPDTWLLGVAVDLRPESGPAAARIGAQLGAEARITDGESGQRAHATAALRGARSGNAHATVEAGVGSEAGTRAALAGSRPAGRRADVRAELRWEDMPPADRAGLARSPIDWLGGDGYGIATLGTRLNLDGWRAMLTGGPAWHPSAEPTIGGMGRASLQAVIDPAHTAGLFASSGAIGGSWVTGGGIAATRSHDAFDLRADAGLFRYQGIDGVAGNIAEVRARLSHPLDSNILIAADIGAGADRQLAPYLTGGVVLQTRVGPPAGALR